MTTEAEQNRLIMDYAPLAASVAADFRGSKGIPFDDLRAEAMVALVRAARLWRPTGDFAKYAKISVRGALRDFINGWQEFVSFEEAGLGDESEDRFYEWTCWQYSAPYENWEQLAASPEDLSLAFNKIAGRQEAFNAAFEFLEPRTRKMIHARFFRRPQQTFESIAREHKLAYSTAVEIIDTALKNMRKQVLAYERNRRNKRHESNIIDFPARAPRSKKSGRPNNKQRA